MSMPVRSMISPSSMSRLALTMELIAQLSIANGVFSLPLPLRSCLSRSSSGDIGISGNLADVAESSDGVLSP